MAVCLTSGCATAAADLIRTMSPNYRTIDPCSNFADFVCQGFDSSHEISQNELRVNTFTVMRENNRVKLRQILQSSVSDLKLNTPAEKENFGKIQDAYSACMNETQIKLTADGSLLKLLAKLDVLYPKSPNTSYAVKQNQEQVVDSDGGGKTLTDHVQSLMNAGFPALIGMAVRADDKDPNKQAVHLTTPPGFQRKSFYEEEDNVKKYLADMTTTFARIASYDLGNSTDDATLFNIQKTIGAYNVSQIFELESKIVSAKTDDPKELYDPETRYNPMDAVEVSKRLQHINVSSIIEKQAPGLLPTMVIVSEPKYLGALSKILEETPRETVNAYLTWYVIRTCKNHWAIDPSKSLTASANLFSSKIVDSGTERASADLFSSKSVDSGTERWRGCVGYIDSDLEWMLSHYYIKDSYSAESASFASRIISDVKSSFISKVRAASWMTPPTRDLTVAKVQAIRPKIGYPTASPDVANPEALKLYYSNLTISPRDHFSNMASLASFAVKKNWAKAGHSTDRDEWTVSAPTVNAFFNPQMVEMVFPAGILQRPILYDPSLPRYLSYGSFGFTAGHELTHAFGADGGQWDINGKRQQWWDNATLAVFENKTECFVGQYNHLTPPPTAAGLFWDRGRVTQGENIADAGGLTTAFQAWKKAEEEGERKDELLPGLLEFSKEQLFFISYANTWCEIASFTAIVQQFFYDPHSAARLRILATMNNSREFKEAFNCPVKEPTCELW